MSTVPASPPPGPATTDLAAPALSRLVTSTRRSSIPRPPSYAKNRVSSSNLSHAASRPPSHVPPVPESSLAYTSVRDFAYPALHPLHLGPGPEPSEPNSMASTPISESHRRLSDPARRGWGPLLGAWSAGPWGGDGLLVAGTSATAGARSHPPRSMSLQDGPPYAEDDDLPSPVVTSRHKRHKSTTEIFRRASAAGAAAGPGPGPDPRRPRREHDANEEGERRYYAGMREDGSETYYVGDGDGLADGPGGEFITYPPEASRLSRMLAPFRSNSNSNSNSGSGSGSSNGNNHHHHQNHHEDRRHSQRDSHFAVTLPNRSYVERGPSSKPADAAPHRESRNPPAPHDPAPGADEHTSACHEADDEEEEEDDDDAHARYSRNYQFTITSPDEEMHGKAVALFDFARENENELPLVEGQVIWVSYRHGQGWLVAEDPRTQESGLVPEEYVRLLRDIDGGWEPETKPGVDGYAEVDMNAEMEDEDGGEKEREGEEKGKEAMMDVEPADATAAVVNTRNGAQLNDVATTAVTTTGTHLHHEPDHSHEKHEKHEKHDQRAEHDNHDHHDHHDRHHSHDTHDQDASVPTQTTSPPAPSPPLRNGDQPHPHASPTSSPHQPSPSPAPPQPQAQAAGLPPHQSTFSTSYKDLDPYPAHLLGLLQHQHPGQSAPHVPHYDGRGGGGGGHGGDDVGGPTAIPAAGAAPATAETAEGTAAPPALKNTVYSVAE
ncbi:MAG: HOG (high osmolarity glycerol) pathway protein [Phylliscum demangeonii]|nr:MAG: HOG (high osmolarity glycerol) pathway protein [Phylliscum demangeonii]